jgi:hypothetical protein
VATLNLGGVNGKISGTPLHPIHQFVPFVVENIETEMPTMNDLELERWWKTPFSNDVHPAVSQTPVASTVRPPQPPSQAHPPQSHPFGATPQTEQSAPPPELRQLELHLTVVLP